MKKHVVATAVFVVLGMAGLSGSGVALGQSASDSPLAFANLDKNHDGFISRSEVPKDVHDLRAHFNQYDQDGNLRLSEAEYAGYLATVAYGACQKNIQGDANPNCGGMSGQEGNLVQRQGETLRANQPPAPPVRTGQR